MHEIPKDALTLLEDAERLVVLYMDCISQCALHVYLSALSFVPKNTAIYKTFKHQSLVSLIIYPDEPRNWAALRRGIDLHTPIYSIVFSPNGDLIATAGEQQGVQVWNAITGGNIASLGNRSSTSLLVRFSPSGAFLAATFEGGTIVVWDPKVGREHMKHEGCHTELITCIEFSKSSALLASGSCDHAIQVWSMETAQALYRLASHEGPVTSLVFSNDSQRLVSGSEDNLVIVWDMLTGKVVRGMMGHRKAVNCVAISKDGSMVASGSEDKTIKIWDMDSGECTETFSKGHQTGIRSVHFFDDKNLVTVCDDAIMSWNIGSHNKPDTIWAAEQYMKEALRRVPAWPAQVLGWGVPKPMLRFILRTTSGESTTRRISTYYATRSPSFVFTHGGSLYAASLPNPMNGVPLSTTGTATTAAISSDGNWAVTGDPLGSLRIIDLSAPARTWSEIEAGVKSNSLRNASKVTPSPDGTRFIIGNLLQWYLVDGDHHILKKIDMGVIGSLHEDGDIRFKFSPDGSIFFCVVSSFLSDDKSTLRVFNALTGEQRIQFSGLKKVHSFVASADGAWIACSHGSAKVEVFGVVGGGRTSMAMSDDESLVNVVVFSDDAQSLIGGLQTGVVHVWDRASGACTATFGVSTSMVTALAYSSSARVAIGREDGSICLWSLSTSASQDVVRSDQATVKHVDFIQFSEDGSRLTSRGEDGTVFTWAITFDADDTDMARCTLCPRQEGVVDDTSNTGHLLSQSDPEDAVDSLFHTAYRVRKDGWLVKGERRLIWMSPLMRPRGKDAFYAYKSRLVVFFAPSKVLVFLKWVGSSHLP